MMIQYFLHRAIMAGTLTCISLAVCTATARAQFVNVTGPQVPVFEVVIPEAGSIRLDSMRQGFNFTFNNGNQFTNGSVSSAVFQRTNGFLDFVYQIDVTSASGDNPSTVGVVEGGVTAINITDFTDFITDAGFESDDIDGAETNFSVGSLRPFRAGRPSEGGIQFTFNASGDGDISTGERSRVLVIRTDATAFGFGTGAVSAQAAGNVLVFAPTAAVVVPEAGTLALLLPGVALGVVAAKRRRNG